MSDPIKPETTNLAPIESTAIPPASGMAFCRSCGKQMHKTALTCPYCGEATAEPKTQRSKLVSLLLAAGLVGVLVVGGFAATLFYPQYMTSREQSNKFEVVAIAKQATENVEKYFREKGGVPKTLEDAGSTSKPATNTIKSMTVHPQKGTITVVLNYGNAEGKSLVYTPTIDDKYIISWACTTKDVPEKLLPPGCKEEERQ
jgi:Tfp pilus assembly protein PilE